MDMVVDGKSAEIKWKEDREGKDCYGREES